VIDFHCHLDLYPEPQKVRDESVSRGLYLLSITTTPSAWKGTSALARSTRIRTALGLHPQLAHERKHELPLFDQFLSETRYVGEIGLDGAPEYRDSWMSQIAVFEHILQSCRSVGGRILSIHSRRASAAVLKYLEQYQGAGTPVLHWFSGTMRDVRRATELGCWFSVGPAMLAAEKGRQLTARMPRDRVVTESDGPFAQIQGHSAMPWDVKEAEEVLAEIWDLPFDSARNVIRENFRNLCRDLPSIDPILP
jgi:TatD DNase family protein